MGRVLVTGAAGFIGSHVCEALLARGDSVVGLDNLDPYYNVQFKQSNLHQLKASPEFDFYQTDVRDAESMHQICVTEGIDRIVHLAGLAGVRASVPRAEDYMQVNTIGSLNLMEIARDIETTQFVLASTSSVYGEWPGDGPFVETASCDRPLAPYPASKRAAELLAHSYHHLHGQSYAVLRFFSVYGPRGRPDMMPFMIADSIANGREIRLFNAGRLQRDWTYVSDIVQGVIGSLDTPLGYEVYNIGRGEPVWMSDFVEILEDLAGKKANTRVVPAPATEPSITFASVRKARDHFGYDPRVSILDGLRDFWAWFSSEITLV